MVISMIYICSDIGSIKEAKRQQLLSLIPETEQKRIKSDEALVAYALLFSKSPTTPLARDTFGKPFFPQSPHFHFSISHTKTAVALAISSAPIGIDIESVHRSLSSPLLKRICSPDEYLQYEHSSTREKITLWTLKEAYAKYKGKGIALPLSSVQFPALEPLSCSDSSIYAETFVSNDFVVSVCGEKMEQVTEISLAEIPENF